MAKLQLTGIRHISQKHTILHKRTTSCQDTNLREQSQREIGENESNNWTNTP